MKRKYYDSSFENTGYHAQTLWKESRHGPIVNFQASNDEGDGHTSPGHVRTRGKVKHDAIPSLTEGEKPKIIPAINMTRSSNVTSRMFHS